MTRGYKIDAGSLVAPEETLEVWARPSCQPKRPSLRSHDCQSQSLTTIRFPSNRPRSPHGRPALRKQRPQKRNRYVLLASRRDGPAVGAEVRPQSKGTNLCLRNPRPKPSPVPSRQILSICSRGGCNRFPTCRATGKVQQLETSISSTHKTCRRCAVSCAAAVKLRNTSRKRACLSGSAALTVTPGGASR